MEGKDHLVQLEEISKTVLEINEAVLKVWATAYELMNERPVELVVALRVGELVSALEDAVDCAVDTVELAEMTSAVAGNGLYPLWLVPKMLEENTPEQLVQEWENAERILKGLTEFAAWSLRSEAVFVALRDATERVGIELERSRSEAEAQRVWRIPEGYRYPADHDSPSDRSDAGKASGPRQSGEGGGQR